jgi:curved DNA-binding protein CbpA
MVDYYSILGVNPAADSTQIRAAFKQRALEYHPDRNPGNPQAEEIFKAVNEAYQVLSDPLKRARYDARIQNPSAYHAQTEAYWRDLQRQQQYTRWRARQQTSQYRFDREYFRIQGLAFLTFLIIAGLCFALIHTITYFHTLKREQESAENRQKVLHIHALFNAGNYDEALDQVYQLRNQYPLEFLFYATHDSLLYVIRNRADEEFNASHFLASLPYLEVLKRHEKPTRLETLRKLAVCEYQAGDFEHALVSMKQIFNQQPWNLELLYQIGFIHLVNLNEPEEAYTYLTLAKRIFKENLTRIYGAAFEVVMIPEDAPDIYYEIFEARARTNLTLKRYTEAETDCNWAIFLRPQRGEAYALRVLAKVNQPGSRNICRDAAKAVELKAEGAAELRLKYCR